MTLWKPPPTDEPLRPDARWADFVGGVDERGTARAMRRADLVAAASGWRVSDEVPQTIAEMLRVARELFVHAWWTYEFLGVSVVWSLLAVEAALRERLSVGAQRVGMRALVREAAQRGLLGADHADRLDAAAQLRNRFAHAEQQVVLTPGMAESFLVAAHESVSEIFRAEEQTDRDPHDNPLWDSMNARPRLAAESASRSSFPDKPGVYAWYRDGTPVYVGKASSLRARIGGAHLSSNPDLTKSALRRNVAEHLGLGSAADIKARRVRPDAESVDRIGAWVRGCDVAWIECESPQVAEELERAMKREWCPMLTRR